MFIKNNNNHSFYNGLKMVGQSCRDNRWILIAASLVLLLIGSNLVSMYYGAYLYKHHQFLTFIDRSKNLISDSLAYIPNRLSGLFSDPKQIEIVMDSAVYKNLVSGTTKTAHLDSLHSSHRAWLPATLKLDGETYAIRIRRDVDLLSLSEQEETQSYTIDVRDDKTVFGMTTFDILRPPRNDWLGEWYFHELLGYLGVLHPQYDFVRVTFQRNRFSIFAIKENLSRDLTKSNFNGTGPILRFTFGDANKLSKVRMFPRFQHATTSYLDNPRISRDGAFTDHPRKARKLLESFRQGKTTASTIFDIEKLAGLFALYELAGKKYAPDLDDLRFYYNPLTSLIEPVGYAFTRLRSLRERPQGLFASGKKIDLGLSEGFSRVDFDDAVFQDANFFKAYVASLERVSQPEFLQDFYAAVEQQYAEKLQIVHGSYPWYKFDGKSVLEDNQKYVRGFLSPPHSIQAYYDAYSRNGKVLTLQVRNIHALPVEIYNVSYDHSVVFTPLRKTVLQAAVESDPIVYETVEFRLPENFAWHDTMIDGLYVTYGSFGASSSSQTSVKPWTVADRDFLQQDLLRKPANHRQADFLVIDENSKTITIKPGSWTLDNDLIIPGGYEVMAVAPLTLDLLNAANIVTYSPIKLIGSPEAFISITSTDHTGQGLAVMSAAHESLLRYVRFDGLSNPNRGKWGLTGAVNFYESPVRIEHTQFSNARAEDALNVIRTKVEMSDSLFIDTLSDAFDGDFIHGSISNSRFVNCGNDAIDISGSHLSLSNIEIEGVGDKGISVGEGSVASLERVEIKNAEIGVTSKDDSVVDVKDLTLYDSVVGMTVFQKKSEFGPALLTVTNMLMYNVSVPYLLEKGSTLRIDNEPAEPTGDNVKGLLYGVEFGKSSAIQSSR